ncbi:MAG: hypothetical protein D3924_14230 [Candidatus Electrothrix sp. AR4]|nr:hypothetical protein [Candidatus Electrothrix sp. AR4]
MDEGDGPSSKVNTTPSVPDCARLMTGRKKLAFEKNGAMKQESRKSDRGRAAKEGATKKQRNADSRVIMPVFSALENRSRNFNVYIGIRHDASPADLCPRHCVEGLRCVAGNFIAVGERYAVPLVALYRCG